jgi:hypothetical protein
MRAAYEDLPRVFTRIHTQVPVSQTFRTWPAAMRLAAVHSPDVAHSGHQLRSAALWAMSICFSPRWRVPDCSET